MPVTGSQSTTCVDCGYENAEGAPVCSLCGRLLAAIRRPPRPAPAAAPQTSGVVDLSGPPEVSPSKVAGIPRPVLYLGIGIPIALVFSAGPLRFAGWFLGALVHELGHTVAALASGCFAFPAIRLDGHAAAVHSAQSTIAVIAIWAAIGVLVWRFRESRRLIIAFGITAAVYPVFAFTGVKDVVHLAAGHLGELVFATIFFSRALSGGFVGKEAERPLYAALGWFWMGGNIVLFTSLIFSEQSRQWYFTNGSFGLANDFVVLARRFGTSLETVAFPMLLLSLCPLPLAIMLHRRRTEADTLHH